MKLVGDSVLKSFYHKQAAHMPSGGNQGGVQSNTLCRYFFLSLFFVFVTFCLFFLSFNDLPLHGRQSTDKQRHARPWYLRGPRDQAVHRELIIHHTQF